MLLFPAQSLITEASSASFSILSDFPERGLAVCWLGLKLSSAKEALRMTFIFRSEGHYYIGSKIDALTELPLITPVPRVAQGKRLFPLVLVCRNRGKHDRLAY